MIIYSHYGKCIAFINCSTFDSGFVERDLDAFFEDNKKELLISWNTEADKKRYPNAYLFSINPDISFIEYCAVNGLNCGEVNEDKNRASYEVLYLVNHYEEVVKPIFDIYMTVIQKYKLSLKCFRFSDYTLLKEVLRWK